MRIKIRMIIILLLFIPAIYAQEESNAAANAIDEISQATSVPANPYEDNLKRWQSLSEGQRQTIRERVKNLTPEQIKELREKSARFRSMPQEQQKKIRTNYQKFNVLPFKQREMLRERYQRFKGLPDERKKELWRQFREKRGMLRSSPAGSGQGNAGSYIGLGNTNARKNMEDMRQDKQVFQGDRRQMRRDIREIYNERRKTQSFPSRRLEYRKNTAQER